MHSVLHSVKVTDQAAAAAELPGLASQLRSLPGFVSSYWLRRPSGQGLAVINFESEKAAERFAGGLRAAPDATGVQLDHDSIEVCQVVVSA